MASFAEEQKIKAHMELIIEDGDYKAYFSQGTNADGVSAWYLTNDSDKAAADTLLDAKVAELTAIGDATANGEGPSDFDGYTPIHFDDSIADAGVDYRTWFVDENADYFKADNGNSDSLVQVTESSEISTLLTDSNYVA
jgi:hypothetical protein